MKESTPMNQYIRTVEFLNESEATRESVSGTQKQTMTKGTQETGQ